jgi:hypothetical protein
VPVNLAARADLVPGLYASEFCSCASDLHALFHSLGCHQPDREACITLAKFAGPAISQNAGMSPRIAKGFDRPMWMSFARLVLNGLTGESLLRQVSDCQTLRARVRVRRHVIGVADVGP